MTKIRLEELSLNFASKETILELVQSGYQPSGLMDHIVSLNPETVVDVLWSLAYRRVVAAARYVVADGIGVFLAIRFLFCQRVPRVSGVDLMEYLLTTHYENSLTVCLIGGRDKVAEQVAECYSAQNASVRVLALNGYHDIFNPKKEEDDVLFRIVRTNKPRLVFVAFGSPQQELWIERHRELFKNAVVIGVGGAFDFLSKRVPRAPVWARQWGLEWLFRLVRQPWRVVRQMKLLAFVLYVLIYKMRLLALRIGGPVHERP